MSTTNLLNRVTINDGICHGKPCIRNLRYPVEMLLEVMASGMSFKEILEDYEDLEQDDLQACLLYTAQLSKVKKHK